ncbi:DUF2062 domain-containing protein [Natronococcus sp. A-GB7]|uniref:DUF2062 domain-containing protein n=1 Tax=Natronococcus sp. A-GB7 TaxID=3037649 RepID=UPI0024203C9F|nr:DUF2062 domain-containing protein [Natronococcus sp. A-GB7]MDG5821225.1 DUF2062 domain-containing protein [Natronococcus sp. A-GB7]
MIDSSWVTRPVLRVRSAFRVAFTEDHPPQWVASSFAFGIFVTALPTLGAGLPVLAWASHRFVWANKVAFVAAVAVLNPLVKGGVYAGSLLIGIQLLGPVPGPGHVEIGLDAGTDVLVRLLVGNVILALGLTVVGYAVAYRTAHAVGRKRA